MTRIAYPGEPGANSHTACMQAMPDYEPLPCATFEDCFAAVENGDAELAMIPLENSIAGRVADIHALMPHSALSIIGEYFLPISFHLMSVPDASLETIRTVESHVMALGQCRNVTRELKLKTQVASDTAGAARMVSEAKDITRAAYAPELAAEIYGLKILRRECQDAAHNTTRFVILSKNEKSARQGGSVMTTFIFRVRNIPAALYKALGGFSSNGINMTKLESYMVGGEFAATMFYVDVEGHPDDTPLKRALEELQFFIDEFKILGVYPAHDFRKKFAK
ncbi:MAG: prephenate dehydratase [Pseudomonadota bacterium]